MSDDYELEPMPVKSIGKKEHKRHREESERAEAREGYEADMRPSEETREERNNHHRGHKRKSSNDDRKKKKKKESRPRHEEESEREDGPVNEGSRFTRDHKKHRAETSDSENEGGSNGRDLVSRRHNSPHRRHREVGELYDFLPRGHKSTEKSRQKDRSSELKDRAGERCRYKEKSRSKERRRSRERDESKERMLRKKTPSPKLQELSPEDRDLRTIFCMQLSTRLDKRQLFDFFTKIGKVRDVHLIRDGKSHRSKGIAYVEFYEIGAASKALDMSGARLDGIPIIVQPSHGDRNRSNMTITTATGKPGTMGPMKLYVGSLHYNITEEMLRGIFEPFGPIDELKIMRDHQTGRSAGYGFIQFRKGEDGKKALEQLNGFELAGRPIKLGSVADYQITQNSSLFDVDESDKVGFGMSATGRIQLMAKLAEGTGFQIPAAAANVLSTAPVTMANHISQAAFQSPPISTQCFILSNMFTADETKDGEWERELKDEVIEECNKHGGVLHIHVDKKSKDGNVYVKCPSIASAMSSVNALHGRFFAGRRITAAYVPLPNYHGLFPDSVKAIQFLMPSNALKSSLPYTY